MRKAIQKCWALALATLVVFVLGCDNAATSRDNSQETGRAAGDQAEQSVSLVIHFDDNERRFEEIEWVAGMTALAVMDAAQDSAGKLAFTYHGTGETAILTSIEGVKNEGAGRSAKNWLYWVDGAFATQGFGVAPVQPGETVTWRFALYDAIDEE